jgi:DNA-binding Lrp family transcriptional regulator
MTDRLRILAKQAWGRIQQLHHDPIESIHKALIYAYQDNAMMPGWVDYACQTQRDIALVLLRGPLRLKNIAKQLGISNRTAFSRLRRLASEGKVIKVRYGIWQLPQETRV